MNKKQRSCHGWGGARSAPFGILISPTGARSAKARTRCQNPLVNNIYLPRVLCHIPVVLSVILSSCHPVCRSCGTLSYSLCFSNQTDQGDKTEGLEREGLEMERYEMERLKRDGVNRVFNVYT